MENQITSYTINGIDYISFGNYNNFHLLFDSSKTFSASANDNMILIELLENDNYRILTDPKEIKITLKDILANMKLKNTSH